MIYDKTAASTGIISFRVFYSITIILIIHGLEYLGIFLEHIDDIGDLLNYKVKYRAMISSKFVFIFPLIIFQILLLVNKRNFNL